MSEYTQKPITPPQSESTPIEIDTTSDEVKEIYTLADTIRDDVFAVDALTEANDLTVLRAQLSSDQLVNDSDVLHTEELIEQSRIEEEEEEESEGSVYEVNVWSILQKGAINLVLPFINGMMLGFGEILAHEVGFRYGWLGAKVEPEGRVRKREQERQQQQQQQSQSSTSRFL
ncbi:uncharacterized protein SPAPADRAFT_135423 [Spathaspora passalidarum NRRL Y-27907]|uniref:Mitochondrial import protein n=1 Tax=Spathaspora passalidarum (strain NRRL Y-27907 / 11-Y1) TaxID=619300 RepID=G3AHQ7_SPAPN|nr:uncharacterized protein SPAPADRAFT_135423 [Spathaspora passalidarum NRRL Y-27907]EGW34221.1 hypothetical protein SPAPADRAFT_135423 [Spathaspora passalidarum NRRL Y-27907]